MTAPGQVAVTGASGYVGRLAARRFAQAGWRVVSLLRPTSSGTDLGDDERRPFVLGSPVEPELLADVSVLIHCAYDLALTDPVQIERVNVDGTRSLLQAAAAAGVRRVVLVSSMSAYDGTTQLYGRAKLACERDTAQLGGSAVRLGLVYGDGWGGMAGSLRRLVRMPFVPLLAGKSYQFTVHEDDAAAGLFALATADAEQPPTIGLAHPDPVPFADLLRAIARRDSRRARLVPLPWPAAYAGMRVAERAGLRLPLRADSLLGLARPAPGVPRVEHWAELGVHLRAFDAGLDAA
ncbi:MAG: NAD-dependent epimerase/dehydratase family protein [Mycobacteriales bacterium]